MSKIRFKQEAETMNQKKRECRPKKQKTLNGVLRRMEMHVKPWAKQSKLQIG